MTGPALFFTGTDTDVGKTAVVAAVAAGLRAAGKSVAVCKPVASGADRIGGRLIADDTRRLADAAGQPADDVTFWTFADPVAPPVAARREGVRLDLGEIAAAVNARRRPGTLLLIEGVGGLLCPLTDGHTVADLIVRLAVPAVAVARRSLGTLNHTLLTARVAESMGIDLRGVVVNETRPVDTLADETNLAELRKWGRPPVLAVCPHAAGGSVDPAALASVDWWDLAGPR